MLFLFSLYLLLDAYALYSFSFHSNIGEWFTHFLLIIVMSFIFQLISIFINGFTSVDQNAALIPLAEFSDPAFMKRYGVKPEPEAVSIARIAAEQKNAVPLMKIYWGDAREKLCEAIDHVPLDSLIIGNRGLGPLRRAIMGSVSNYVVNNASCPVTVVKIADHGHHH